MVFFFSSRRRHTRFDCDWSSDVCSSDLSKLNAKTIFGGEHKNEYLLETTGCGVAFYDYDNDGWLDIFLVNGTRLEGFPSGQEPTNHLFKNNRDGTFTDRKSVV